MDILFALLCFAGISMVLGLMLAVASKIFAVKVDPRIPEITDVLPGANCGGCGSAGCSACAEAIVSGAAKTAACPVGGQSCADAIAAIMGTQTGTVTRMRAQVMCSGGHDNAKQKYLYEGPHDCAAAMRLGGGPKECPNGCIGFGSCALLCPNHAITVENGIAVVHADKCFGCGICVESCPKRIIKLIPFDAPVHVGCSSLDRGSITRTYCEAGCIGCMLCTKVCESGAITVKDSIASINYDLCTHCGKCAEKCPRSIIFVEEGKCTVAPPAPQAAEDAQNVTEAIREDAKQNADAPLQTKDTPADTVPQESSTANEEAVPENTENADLP